ncbi:tubulin-like doman-containing protein [Candidatus Villigracilis saccharophilus]|uniref:tubulin-like doman-containing protein n=1 Tax=Candidatus Villigracilis saccharophilus TaxID=3140684 RepID=UPI0031366693|nr:hypothetical protein [Anaerolineales bacterium]
MTRPAIIIGLGGTGQWVLTFLKKELLEIGGGTMPSGVKLLSFDTTTRTTAETGQTGKRKKEEDISAGAVRLVEGKEFIPIGDNIGSLVSEIAAGKYPHLQWFPAKSFLSKLPPAAFNTKEGSGQIRHMGRISIFRDLAAIQRSEILSRLRAAMQDLQGKVSRDTQMEIIIVGSLAGGTGAGMLVDMALLVRAQAAKVVANNYVVRGFFILPRAFTAGGLGEGRDMLARSFAAWRELDRFMIVSERFGLRQINYHESNQDLRLRLDRRAYDVSYMVDPARQTVNSLDNVRAEEGLFPGVAHVVSAILDEQAGKAYTEFITTNLAGKLAQLPRRPYHSAIGSYTLKVPVFYAEEKFSHQLALDVLRQFLAPEVNDKGRVTGVSEIRNREVPDGESGVQSALKFMFSSASNVNGKEIPNTKFLPLLAEVREKEGLRNDGMIQQIARGGLTVGNSRYLSALTDISQDDEGKLIMRDIQDELNHPIWGYVAPSRVAGDTPDSAFSRIKNKVPAVRQEHYGVDTAGGERLRGKYGKALEQAKNAQVARFRHLLKAWTLHALNGDSPDPQVARGGKIGYVRSSYLGLLDNFDYFVKFLNSVRQTRNENLRLAARTRQAADSSLKEYERLRGKKCWLPFWDDFTHPDAHRAQRNYLMAEQRDIDVRKDDILLDVLAETTLEMRAIAEKGLNDIQSWITHLATGDQNIKVNGLYPEAMESLANVNVNHEIDKRMNKISQLIGEHEYKTDAAFVAEALDRLKWDVLETADGLRTTCGIEFPSDDPSQPNAFSAFRREGENASTINLEMILKLAQRPFKAIYKERPLAKEVMKIYPTGTKLAESVDKLAEPLYMPATSVLGPEVVACYIRAHSNVDDETTRYFSEFETEMKDRNPNIKGASLTLVDSEDHHKLTIVRSDDLIPSMDFQMWQACRDAYIQQVTDPHRGIPAAELHIFPAEINACVYESDIPKLIGKNYRTLHPEVVALLEDKERFEMFLRAYALGFIKVAEGDGGSYWAYQLPEDVEPLYLSVPSKSMYGAVKEDIFQVIHNFVMEGVDQRPGMNQQRYVDWEKLLDAILKAQRDLGKAKTIKAYRQQIEDPKGVVDTILADVVNRRAAISDEVLRKTIGQEHEDLADVSKVVYLKAIQAFENLSSK